MKLALSILCENPARKTGLTTLFHEFVAHALGLFPDLSWIVFAGPRQPWTLTIPRVEVVRRYPANDRLPGGCSRTISSSRRRRRRAGRTRC